MADSAHGRGAADLLPEGECSIAHTPAGKANTVLLMRPRSVQPPDSAFINDYGNTEPPFTFVSTSVTPSKLRPLDFSPNGTTKKGNSPFPPRQILRPPSPVSSHAVEVDNSEISRFRPL